MNVAAVEVLVLAALPAEASPSCFSLLVVSLSTALPVSALAARLLRCCSRHRDRPNPARSVLQLLQLLAFPSPHPLSLSSLFYIQHVFLRPSVS